MAGLSEFLINVVFNGDEKKVNSFQNSMKNLTKEMLILKGTFIAVSYGLDKLIQTVSKDVVLFDNFNKQTGLSIDKLQEWQKAASLSNLSLGTEQVMANIQSLQKNITDIKMGSGDISGFAMLGINPTNAFDVLDKLRDKIQGLDNATASNVIQRLGLSPEFLNVLRLSNDEFKKLSQGSFLSAKNREDMLKLATSIKMIKISFKELKDQAIAKIAPDLEKLVKTFFKWMKDNGKQITDIISGFVKIFSKFAEAIGRSFSFLVNLVNLLTQSKIGMMGLVGVATTLLVAFTPLGKVFSKVNLFLLLFVGFLDDIQTWREGGDSLFGGLYEGIAKIGELLKNLGVFDILDNIAKGFFDLIKGAIEGIAWLIEKLNQLPNLIGKITGFFGKNENENSLTPNTTSIDKSISSKSSNQNITINQEINSNSTSAKDVAGLTIQNLKSTQRLFQNPSY